MLRVQQYFVGLFRGRVHPYGGQLWGAFQRRDTRCVVGIRGWRPGQANAVAEVCDELLAVLSGLDDGDKLPVFFSAGVEAVSADGVVRQDLYVDAYTGASRLQCRVLFVFVESAVERKAGVGH
ncbi:hypothetical protein D3C84_878960 [compost metagenome]